MRLPLTVVQHEDVHRLLYDLAVKAGAEIIFGAQVAGVTPSEEMPSITLANGETHRADVIIAADGPNSFIRGMILEGEESPRPEGHTIFGGIIPAADMQDDEEFKSLVGSPEVRTRAPAPSQVVYLIVVANFHGK